MPIESPTWRFRSALFKIIPKEDEATNPFCYGLSLAQWLKGRFTALGYDVEEVIAEDWGWCVMLARRPFMLWIGCGNDSSAFDGLGPEQQQALMAQGDDLEWSCFVATDVPVWTGFFWRRLVGRASTDAQVQVAAQQLEQVLSREPGIRMLQGGPP